MKAKLLSILMALAMLLTACSGKEPAITPEPTPESTPEIVATPEPEPEPVESASELSLADAQWEKSSDGSYYQLLGVHYCTNISVEQYQTMNIYVPAEYFEGGEVCGYTADTAPIVLENNCAGWRSGEAGKVESDYIENGFVYVNCGARSRGAGENGEGKAPAPVVDLKSAVRTLRLNAENIPGDEEKIISIGTSGAGEMSSILGASGNMEEYWPYLYENGAPGVEYDEATDSFTSTIDDDIFAAMCYCPIADLENADLAYAWWRYDCGDSQVSSMMDSTTILTEFQKALEQDLALAFCEYINSLGLKNEEGKELYFDTSENGDLDPRSGSFYEQILENLSDSFNLFIAANTDEEGNFSYTRSGGKGPGGGSAASYDSLEDLLASYSDVSAWLTENGDGSYSVTDMRGFLLGTSLSRGKNIPGFDTMNMDAENNAFGTAEEEAVHFSASVAAVLEANYERYSALEGFNADEVDAYIEEASREDIACQTYLMNATAIMLDCAKGEQDADIARFWRVRSGTADEHTSFSIGYNLAMSAIMAGAEADYSLVWAMPHGNNEGSSTGTFIDWVHEICTDSQDEDAADNEKSERPMGGGGRGNGGGMSANVENDADALAILAECAPKFKQFTFTDPDTGFELEYSLFIPEGWDGSTAYPLVQFMPDSTGTGKSAKELVENYLGAAIWASDRDQAKHPCFVLVPAYTNTLADDDWSVSPQLETGIKLLRWIIEEYNVDESRIYTTGQSGGCMASLYLSSAEPELFAASLYVGGQWDIGALGNLCEHSFVYITAGGDTKATGGQTEVMDMLSDNNVEYSFIELSAELGDDPNISQNLSHGMNANFIRFETGTVAPAGSNFAAEHMASFNFAYKLDSVRDWLFEQIK